MYRRLISTDTSVPLASDGLLGSKGTEPPVATWTG